MIRTATILAIVALPVAAWCLPCAAQDVLNLAGTTITLQPTERPGAVAEIVFHNVETNDDNDEGQTDLTGAGITVGVTFDWNVDAAGADAIVVTVPDGLLCHPADCVLSVPETGVRTMWIYDLEGVGS